jgi:hypothetical protein
MMIPRLFLLSIILLYGCIAVPGTSINDNDFKCDDGRIVKHPRFCEVEEPVRAVPEDKVIAPSRQVVDETQMDVMSEEAARQAFREYVESNRLDYKLVSIESQSDGYEIVYSHPQGRGMVIIGNDGKVYEELGAI